MDPHEDDKIERLRQAMYSREYADKLRDPESAHLAPDSSVVGNDWKLPEHSTDAQASPYAAVARRHSMANTIVKWALIASIIFFVGALGFFFYFLTFGGTLTGQNIGIVITGPSQVGGGEQADFEVQVTNKSGSSIQLANLTVTFPDGTRLPATQPNDPSEDCSSGTACSFFLQSIAAGGTSSFKIPVTLEGNQGTHASIKAQLTYHLPDSSAVFAAQAEYAFVFSSSPLSLSINANTQAISGQPMQVALTVSSNASTPLDNVLLNASFPFGFRLSSATPSPDSSGVAWNLGTIAPGQSVPVTLTGVLTGQPGDNRTFHFVVGTGESATSTTVSNPLSDGALAVSIAQPFLGITVSVNGATTTGPVAISPGEIVNVAINYRNNLSSEITNAIVVAKLSGVPINGSTVQSETGFYRSTDSSLLWDKTTANSALASLPAGASGTLTFSFQAPSDSDLQGIVNPSISVSVDAAGTRVGNSGVPQTLQSAALQQITLASNLAITSQGLYFGAPTIASGAIPPKANAETDYAAVLNITNTTNQINNAVVTAQLPSYVRLVSEKYSSTVDNLNFNPTTGVLTWTIGTIAPNTGLNGTPPVSLEIPLGFTPSTSQIGTQPALLQSITLTGTDASTGASITKTASDITTNIAGDPGFTSANADVVR